MKRTFFRKLIKFSNYSTCITLPKTATEELDWIAGMDIEIKLDPKKERLTITRKPQTEKKSKQILPNPVKFEISPENELPPPLITRRNSEKNKPDNKEDELTPLEEL